MDKGLRTDLKLEEEAKIYFDHIVERCQEYEFKTFVLGASRLVYEGEDALVLKRTLGVALYEHWLEEFDREVDWKRPELILIMLGITDEGPRVSLKPRSVYLYGRYRKLERGISQSRWVCQKCQGKGCHRCQEKGRFYTESVQELLAHNLCPAFESNNLGFFHGMGREDVDVLMLGQGRPFVLEILKAKKRSVDLEQVARELNDKVGHKVQVGNLAIVDGKAPAKVKGVTPDKSYRARCQFVDGRASKEKIASLSSFFENRTLEQRTPQRVSNRRADLVRKRDVRSLLVEAQDEDALTLHIRTQSGTYIKELITSDEGRTTPSISEYLGVSCICSKLDVLDIHISDEDAIRGSQD
jgi:tRNA pseudouridine synthase 10